MARFSTPALSLAFLLAVACSDEPPPGGGGTRDAGGGGGQTCDDDNPCPTGQTCNGGVCEIDAPRDAGQTPEARMQVCTEEGCLEPYRINFGGSRIGAVTEQTLILRSVGEAPLEISNLDILAQGTEFTVDPGGELDVTLQPNEELVVRVSHVATDGIQDNEQLQIITNTDPSRVLVQLLTEYKGVPSLLVSEQANTAQIVTDTLDFGNVRAGVAESRTLYIKNRDTVLNGSVLTVEEVRIDPGTSTNFAVTPDAEFPALLNQFNAYCMNDGACDTDL
ncbi:MAG: hypothetical protein RL846_14010, partial [Deltaproteobacteria bacterium]